MIFMTTMKVVIFFKLSTMPRAFLYNNNKEYISKQNRIRIITVVLYKRRCSRNQGLWGIFWSRVQRAESKRGL